jgi:Leucine-rich repeat (LRR) protein
MNVPHKRHEFSISTGSTGRVSAIRCVGTGLLLVGLLVGCEEIAKLQEGQPATTDSAPASAPQPNQPSQPTVNVIKPQPAAQPAAAALEDPQAVIAKFMDTPTTQRHDNDLARICGLPAGTEGITVLDLNSAPITDEGLKHITKLANLESLNLTNTKITEAGFAATLATPKLRTLNLTGCLLSPGMLETLSKLENLEELLLDRTSITDKELVALESLGKLKLLDLSSTQISDAGFQSLAKLTSLETLRINHTSVTGQGMQFFKRKKGEHGLRVLEAHHSQFGREGLQYLKNVETLEELELSQAEVNDRSLLGLRNIRHLKKLRLGFNQVTDAGLSVLTTTQGIEEIYLRNIQTVSDATLGHVSKNKALRVIDVNGTSCTINGVRQLKKYLPDCQIHFMGTVH